MPDPLSPEAVERVKAERRLVADIQAQCLELDAEAHALGYRSHIASDLLRRLLSDRIKAETSLTEAQAALERVTANRDALAEDLAEAEARAERLTRERNDLAQDAEQLYAETKLASYKHMARRLRSNLSDLPDAIAQAQEEALRQAAQAIEWLKGTNGEPWTLQGGEYDSAVIDCQHEILALIEKEGG